MLPKGIQKCTRCDAEKTLEDFPLNPVMKSGRDSWCYTCRAEDARNRNRKRRGLPLDAGPLRVRGEVRRDAQGRVTGKVCAKCRRDLPAASFHVANWQASGIASYCRECRAEMGAELHVKKTYGLTLEQVGEIRLAQDNKCAICGTDNPNHLDHDHATGKVRSLLCTNCNMGLGQFKDDPELLRKAADYLGSHRTTRLPVAQPRHVVR